MSGEPEITDALAWWGPMEGLRILERSTRPKTSKVEDSRGRRALAAGGMSPVESTTRSSPRRLQSVVCASC